MPPPNVVSVLYDSSGNEVGIVLDGAVYRLQALTKVANSSGSQIDPATQGTLESVDTKLGTIDSVLDGIKDTDGIKKITDQLPAGTNEVGKVAQGTRAAASAAWPLYLADSSGNVVGVVLDDTVYRAQVDGKIAKCPTSGDLVHLDTVGVTSGCGRLKATLYDQSGDPVAFAATSTSIKLDFVKNGSNPSLLVDGSVTPVAFTYTADSTYDISVQEIKFTLVSKRVTFGKDYFGAVSGPLTNGLLVEATVNDGTTVILGDIHQNEDFVNFASPGGFEWVVSAKDMMSASYVSGGGLRLIAGTSDNIKVTVQDDIDSAGVYLQCWVKGNLTVTA